MELLLRMVLGIEFQILGPSTLIGDMSQVRRPTSLTTHKSDGPQVRCPQVRQPTSAMSIIDSPQVRCPVRRPTSPTAHKSDGPQVRRPTSPTAHKSDGPQVRRPTSPTAHKSDGPQVRRPKSDGPQVRRPTSPTAHKSDVGMCDSTRYIRKNGGNDICRPKIDPKMLFFSTL